MSISRPAEPVQHDPLVCGLGEFGAELCPGCAHENKQEAINAKRRRRRRAWLKRSATHGFVLRFIRKELERELSPIIAHLKHGGQ